VFYDPTIFPRLPISWETGAFYSLLLFMFSDSKVAVSRDDLLVLIPGTISALFDNISPFLVDIGLLTSSSPL